MQIYPRGTKKQFTTSPDVEILVNGRRRRDVHCERLSISTGTEVGKATLHFPNGTYDSKILSENDRVEIYVYPYGCVWRGYIVARDSALTGGVRYTALDFLSKLNDSFAPFDYNQEDPVTGVSPTNSARTLARQLWQFYYLWQSVSTPQDYKLTFDLATFPDVDAGPQNVKGMGILNALQTIVESIDHRHRIVVEHNSAASVVRCAKLSEGDISVITRATDPTKSYHSQPFGIANAGDVRLAVDTSGQITHVAAEGSNRIVERGFTLTSDWNQVADGYTPPEGQTIKDFVTDTEADNVINNWERYTTESYDISGGDNDEDFTTKNPYYRKKYEWVGRRFAIPTINDYWYTDDDTNNEPSGYASKQVELESKLVQTFDDQELQPFILYSRNSSPSQIEIQWDGFSIVDNKYVEFTEPFVDKINKVFAKGNKGHYVVDSWDSGTNTSQYTILDPKPDDVQTLSGDEINAGSVFLYLGELNLFYQVVGVVDASTISVLGRLTDAVGLTDGTPDPDVSGSDWMIVRISPDILIIEDAEGEPGKIIYDIAGDDTIYTNEYINRIVVVGPYNESTGFNADPTTYQFYRVIRNTAKAIYVDAEDQDFPGTFSDQVVLYNIRTDEKDFFNTIVLNAAYRSGQRLQYNSGDIGNSPNKRIVYKNNNDFEWKTEYGNYQLVKSEVEGEEDKFTVTFNDTFVDKTKELEGLSTWALRSIKGSDTEAQYSYSINLPFMALGAKIGDRIKDNAKLTTATITGIEHDLVSFATNITATSI